MKDKPKEDTEKSQRAWHFLLYCFVVLTVVIFCICLVFGLTSRFERPIAHLFFFSLVYAAGWAVLGTLVAGFFIWVWCWRNFKRFLIGLACIVVLILLAYTEEDLRGYLDWNSYKRQLEAKGEKLDFSDFIPPAVPDDQNFAMTPIVSTSYGGILSSDGKPIPSNERDKNYVNRMAMQTVHDGDNTPTNGLGNWQTAKMSDLSAWQRYYRTLAAKTSEFPVSPEPQAPAADVLLALSKYDPAIEELHQAAQLPESRFPLNYSDEDPAEILLPHLAAIKQTSQVLQLRALAELQNNQSDKAFDDVKLMFRLADSVRTEPFIITHLVRAAIVQIALQPVYEGMANHQWSDAQLVELDSELAKLDFLADYKFSVGGERASSIKIVAWLKQHPGRLQEIWGNSGSGGPGPVVLLSLAPKGWFYQNDLSLAQSDQASINAVDDKQQIVSPRASSLAGNSVRRALRHSGPYNVLAQAIVPQLGAYASRAAYAQNAVNMARIAAALERFRLANFEYPGSLDALAPRFMEQVPHDVINGDPLHYSRTSDGQFILYSVGWNGVDDGGKVATSRYGFVDRTRGDWVWRYPEK